MNYYQSGRRTMEEGNISAAHHYFQTGLTEGDARCAYGLVALAARTGESLGTALEMLKMALHKIQEMAENRDADACFIMGRCCETGSVVSRNIPAAIAWYTQSASLGNADAMFNLGCIYMKLDTDAEQLALDQFRRAAEGGCKEAKLALDHYYRCYQ